jgi:hypothetical protein
MLALFAAGAGAQTTFGPAPNGPAEKVALRIIREAEHPCPKVTKARRDPSGGIRAMCSNGEEYVIASMSNPKHGTKVFALKCSAARALLQVEC